LSNAIAYLDAAKARGQNIEQVALRMSFFFVSRTTVLEEVAKFRAARQIWAKLIKERFGISNERAMHLRFHTQTAGVQLTAAQPELNLVRVTLQAIAAVLGGTQSLHTNSFDEALGLPTEKAALLALRTQQVIAYESDLARTVDALAGSAAIETLTRQLAEEIENLIAEVDHLGGAVAGVEAGFQKSEIEKNAYRISQEIERKDRIIVGVNEFVSDPEGYQPLRVDESVAREQSAKLQKLRSERDLSTLSDALEKIRGAAEGNENLMPVIKSALLCGGTVGEICNALRDVWGTYRAPESW
jgi:methylmalonyl-CoA mutase N-terminal domain/subunit